MPNHYTTKLQIRGSKADIATFNERHFVRIDDELKFDFNTIIPMPSILRNSESSSTVDDGLAVMGSKLARQPIEAYLENKRIKEKGISTIEGVKRLLVEQSPDCLTKALLAIEAYRQTGHTNWYTWSNANWGTKWNSYELCVTCNRPTMLNFTFCTAWAPPIPIIVKLVEMYPLLTIKTKGQDECDSHWETLIA